MINGYPKSHQNRKGDVIDILDPTLRCDRLESFPESMMAGNVETINRSK